MTQNQIAYQQLLEQQRANKEREKETTRSNQATEGLRYQELQEKARNNLVVEAETERNHRAVEAETNRNHLVQEQEQQRSNLARELENNRANVANEQLKAQAQAEQERSNRANESLKSQAQEEQARANRANEALAQQRNDETERQNRAQVDLEFQKLEETQRSNVARESETQRHDEAQEGVSRVNAAVSNQSVRLDAAKTLLNAPFKAYEAASQAANAAGSVLRGASGLISSFSRLTGGKLNGQEQIKPADVTAPY